MSVKQLTGVCIIASPFAALFALAANMLGPWYAAGVFVCIALTVAAIAVGAFMLADD